MPKIIKTLCGKAHSTSGKLFTHATKNQHEHHCPDCRRIQGLDPDSTDGLNMNEESGLNQEILDSLDDDMSDGAYWAMYNEREGNF